MKKCNRDTKPAIRDHQSKSNTEPFVKCNTREVWKEQPFPKVNARPEQLKITLLLDFLNLRVVNLFSETVDSRYKLRLEVAEVDGVQSGCRAVKFPQHSKTGWLCFCITSDERAQPSNGR